MKSYYANNLTLILMTVPIIIKCMYAKPSLIPRLPDLSVCNIEKPGIGPRNKAIQNFNKLT